MFITGSVFCFVTFVLYAIATWVLLIYANVVIAAIETVWGVGYWFDDCLDESRAMFSSAGVGCLIATIGALGAFVSSICASCRRMHEPRSAVSAPVPQLTALASWGGRARLFWLRCALQRAAHNAFRCHSAIPYHEPPT